MPTIFRTSFILLMFLSFLEICILILGEVHTMPDADGCPQSSSSLFQIHSCLTAYYQLNIFFFLKYPSKSTLYCPQTDGEGCKVIHLLEQYWFSFSYYCENTSLQRMRIINNTNINKEIKHLYLSWKILDDITVLENILKVTTCQRLYSSCSR